MFFLLLRIELIQSRSFPVDIFFFSALCFAWWILCLILFPSFLFRNCVFLILKFSMKMDIFKTYCRRIHKGIGPFMTTKSHGSRNFIFYTSKKYRSKVCEEKRVCHTSEINCEIFVSFINKAQKASNKFKPRRSFRWNSNQTTNLKNSQILLNQEPQYYSVTRKKRNEQNNQTKMRKRKQKVEKKNQQKSEKKNEIYWTNILLGR